MPPNSDPSPREMLWAHQLKREHGFLLDRMKKLEAEIAKIGETAKSTQKSSSSQDIAAIARKVKTLAEDEGSKASDELRKEVMGRLENVDADLEAITVKLATIDQQSAKIEEERKKTFSDEKALLKRVKEVEEHLGRYEKNLRDRGDQVNQAQMDVIRNQLTSFINQVSEGDVERSTLKEDVQHLDEVTKALRQRNEELANEVTALSKRPAALPQHIPPLAPRLPAYKTASTALPVPGVDKDGTSETARPSPTTQKTANGARKNACSKCRKARKRCEHNIATEGGDEEEDTGRLAQNKSVAASSKKNAAPATTMNPPPRTTQSRSKATRTAAEIKKEGMEAPEVETEKKVPATSRMLKSLKPTKEAIEAETNTQRAAEKPILKSGRGCFYVARTPSAAQNVPAAQISQDSAQGTAVAERITRGRGRPRKVSPSQQAPPVVAKRGRGRPRKDPSQASQAASVDTPKRGRGRSRKHGTQTAVKKPAAPARRRLIKQEPEQSRTQPMRGAKALQTIEKPTPKKRVKAAPIKKEPGLEKKVSALEALRSKRQGGLTTVPSSSPMSSPPPAPQQDKRKRKAVESAAQPAPKRRTIDQGDDEENERMAQMWTARAFS